MKIKISPLSNLDENVLNSPVVTEQVMLSGYWTRDELTALHTCLVPQWHHIYFHLIFNTFYALSGVEVWTGVYHNLTCI